MLKETQSFESKKFKALNFYEHDLKKFKEIKALNFFEKALALDHAQRSSKKFKGFEFL